ncbi:patatin-like phospholipase family protein [Vitiosangium sp. GDMCC 1.1324]|uniref:patatin-like phospholipase family protein n=1 Tax=Vitiosangium sp. (strain GDMCC 1.1324) TaxID=2138576 RepID=UPI000D38FB52|nr:patatin-like phospholipase family protein [Vitiosangium sp. GDMCC 1.1324]PTL80629.1 patatin [Vitiosangium sp. GDMCC 1.1324]
MAERIATLVLSGGGAKGAFEVGAERVLREEFGFRWERIFGVSVGALNGTLLAQEEYARLMNLWLTIREGDIYKKIPWPLVAFRVGIQSKLGFYDNTPLRALIQKHAAGRPFRIPAHVGRVSLVSGEYEQVDSTAPDFLDAVWHSATMPVIWEAIGSMAYVDGGLRNVTPLGDALNSQPKEIVVITCNSARMDTIKPPSNILDVAKRSLTDITINEILRNDVEEFVRINDLVKQAHDAGVTLKKPDGTPYVYCPIVTIEPEKPLGDTLDFSQETIRLRMRHGEEVARSVIQQTGVARPQLAATLPTPEHPTPA